MRVLVVAPLYHTDRGGLGRQAVLLTERLAELGVEALVATRRMTGLPERRFSPQVLIRRLRAGRPDVHNYEAKSARNLLTSLRFSLGLLGVMTRDRRRYDVIHVHGASLPLMVAVPWARLLGKRVIGKVAALHQGVEAGDLREHYGPLGPVMAWLVGKSDAFVATTAEIAAALRAEGHDPDQIVRIPNFVDTARFRRIDHAAREQVRSALGWSDRTVVLHSGRLSRRKAGEVLIEAFAQAAVDREDALLVFLGDGPRRSELERQVREMGLEGRVQFPGFHTDVERYLQAADVLAIASRVEGLPNALLEGMACGLPVVATRLGGSLEVVIQDRTGIMVPVDDVDALSAGLARLLGDPPMRMVMGMAGARRIQETFTLEAIAPRYQDLYRRLVTGEVPQGASLFV